MSRDPRRWGAETEALPLCCTIASMEHGKWSTVWREVGGKGACGTLAGSKRAAAVQRMRGLGRVRRCAMYVAMYEAMSRRARPGATSRGVREVTCTADVGILMCEEEDKAQGRCTSSCRSKVREGDRHDTDTSHGEQVSRWLSCGAAHERHNGMPMHVWQRVGSGASRRASPTLHWRRLRRAMHRTDYVNGRLPHGDSGSVCCTPPRTEHRVVEDPDGVQVDVD